MSFGKGSAGGGYGDLGLLLIRLGVGFSMAIFHGYGKISGGPELWTKIGASMGHFGIHFAPAFWGFLSALAEFGCSILLIVGLFFRPAAAALAFNMLVASTTHLTMPAGAQNAGWSGASHAIELLAVYLGLLLLGPGRYALIPKWRRG